MAVIATGFFDGVHLGHRKVIDALLASASGRGERSVVLTFWPHPRIALQNDAQSLRLLTSVEEKREMLLSMGVSAVEVLPFDREFASMIAERYLREVVRDRFGGTAVVVGYDNRIGSDNVCAAEIGPLASSLGLDVVNCAPLGDISSTKIRACISSGKVSEAAVMLGRPYSVKGTVIEGNSLGHTIGYPTANMKLDEPLLALPSSGVYYTRVHIGERDFPGMTNVSETGLVETHILGLNERIYGSVISVDFIKYLRAEKKFQSLEELRKQLDIDLFSCKNITFGV